MNTDVFDHLARRRQKRQLTVRRLPELYEFLELQPSYVLVILGLRAEQDPMVVNCETVNDALEVLQGPLLLKESFLVVLELVEKVRGEDILKKTEDVVSDEHVERVEGEEVLVDGLPFLVEDGLEE